MARLAPLPAADITAPFLCVEEAWFWFMKSLEAQQDGAKARAGFAHTPRPCEPADILKLVERLYQKRMLLIDHIRVLIHYGRRCLPPNPKRFKEERAFYIWQDALARLETAMRGKGIVQ